METFIAIILVVFGILQIILFFKLWGMTNDVEKIKKQITEGSSRVINARIEQMKGNSIKAKELLDEDFYSRVIEADSNLYSWYDYNEEYEKIAKTYSTIYEKFELEKPDFGKYKREKN